MASEHFDSRAAEWDTDPAKVLRARQVADALVAAIPVPHGARLLEYGAGTGLVSQALREHVGPIVLADNSAGMRTVMQRKIDDGALPDAQVWDLDLEQDPVPQEQFDLVVSSLVLHHVQDLSRVLAGFAALLRPGGHVCIADLDREDGSFHDHDFGGHHGFDRSELADSLQRAGFTDVTISDCGSIDKEGTAYSVFLAVAQR
ncbi:class I SAM-dependent methyltransferase [Ornithinimicrobium ciconiae]|uniref:Class I SAM-dependent methyltransferase n=1 Tax=Ornithinimicrobium ciconiae TaxID=2594265 RepID=A0A516GCQ2_9MICO|nr:class I SAM-dependent methyltransferase [Ornithinimicrobium ciconiae]QDO89277.1 class I SAM-dependent methyltransferase [Ornithinimicrobium ciconiae]